MCDLFTALHCRRCCAWKLMSSVSAYCVAVDLLDGCRPAGWTLTHATAAVDHLLRLYVRLGLSCLQRKGELLASVFVPHPWCPCALPHLRSLHCSTQSCHRTLSSHSIEADPRLYLGVKAVWLEEADVLQPSMMRALPTVPGSSSAAASGYTSQAL
jgi:hypothetical protein